jgi:hypothetical protein
MSGNIIDPTESKKEEPVQTTGKIVMFLQSDGQVKIEWQGVLPNQIPAILSAMLASMLNGPQQQQPAVQLPPVGLDGHKLRK